MMRREFLATAGAAALAAPALAAGTQPSAAAERSPGQRRFKLHYAPHFGMFRNHGGGGGDPIDELKFMADQGFTALEDNGMAGRDPAMQEKIGKELDRLGMRMGVFVVNMGTAWNCSFAAGKEDTREAFLNECKSAVEVAKRVNAEWMTVVPGTLEPRLEMDYQTANVIDQLKRGAEIFEPHNLVMVLEPLNPWRDHPNMYLSKAPQAYLVCEAVNSPACKILFDIYHQQITEGNLIPNIDRCWDQIAYFQVGDNPGRNEPGTGEINYRNVFRHIHGRGFEGIVGMEHGNSRPGKEGEQAVIEAYAQADAF